MAAYELTWDFEALGLIINVGKKPEGIDGNSVNLLLQPRPGKDPKAGQVLDAICTGLHRFGIDLTYALDDKGELTEFAFNQRVGERRERKVSNEHQRGHDGLMYEIYKPKAKAGKPSKHGYGEGFGKFKSEMLKSQSRVVWKRTVRP